MLHAELLNNLRFDKMMIVNQCALLRVVYTIFLRLFTLLRSSG